MDVILLDVLDTTGLPNLQPSCGFCKWTNGKYSICSRLKRAAFGPARFDLHFDFEWCKNRVGYRSAAEQQSGHPGKWSQMLLPSREPRILASHLLQRKFVPTSVCSKQSISTMSPKAQHVHNIVSCRFRGSALLTHRSAGVLAM